MTVLAIEAGNTRIKAGLFEVDSAGLPHLLGQTVAWPHGSPLARDTLTQLARGTHISEALVSGSRPSAVEGLTSLLKTRGLFRPPLPRLTVVSRYDQIAVPLGISFPETVGLDRLLAARAALVNRPVGEGRIIISAGTATTVDLIDREGRFAGGAILPGIDLGGQALHTQTELLPLMTAQLIDPDVEVLGRHTRAAIASGLLWGQVGAVREIASRLARDHSVPGPWLLTGGAAPWLAPGLASLVTPRPDLTLFGLALTSP